MQQLYALLKKHNNELNYEHIHGDKNNQEVVYAPIVIHCEQSPFDYIDHLWLDQKDEAYALIFVEPVGNISFQSRDLVSLFEGINRLFNSQPEGMDYAVAGHKIHYYKKTIRKGFAIDFAYLDTDVLWKGAFDEVPMNPPTFDELRTGRDVFRYVQAKNRLAIGVIDDLYFYGTGLEEGMMGEIIHVEEQMPDFFKALIDLTRFNAHNQRYFAMNVTSLYCQDTYPENRLVEVYFSYEQTLIDETIIQLLKKEDIKDFQEEAHAFWLENDADEFATYRKK